MKAWRVTISRGKRGAWLCVILALCSLAPLAQAHEVRPGFLQIQEIEPEAFQLLWKVPARGDYRLGMYVQMPAQCAGDLKQATLSGGAFVERWHYRCPGGLAGETISIDGLGATRTDVLVRIEHANGTTETLRLTPEQTSFQIAETPRRQQVAWSYLVLGVEHILLGIDHLLFVLGLMFLADNWRRLVLTVTAFTIAHSITLGAATLGFLEVPQAPVEATIALSVMFVAGEILRGSRGQAGLASTAPWMVAFLFGLLHGLGFASALHEIGLPDGDIPLALLLFNVGVELGQLLFIGVAVVALALVHRCTRLIGAARAPGPWHADSVIRTPVAYLIGSLSAFWVIERVINFWA